MRLASYEQKTAKKLVIEYYSTYNLLNSAHCICVKICYALSRTHKNRQTNIHLHTLKKTTTTLLLDSPVK